MALDDDIALISKVPTFALLEPDALRLLAFAAQQRQLAAGEWLFRAGDRADAAFVVVSGHLDVEIETGEHVQARTGDMLGELALFVETDRRATAIAPQEVTVLRIGRDLMSRVLREFPRSAAAIRERQADRLAELKATLASIEQRLRALDEV